MYRLHGSRCSLRYLHRHSSLRSPLQLQAHMGPMQERLTPQAPNLYDSWLPGETSHLRYLRCPLSRGLCDGAGTRHAGRPSKGGPRDRQSRRRVCDALGSCGNWEGELPPSHSLWNISLIRPRTKTPNRPRMSQFELAKSMFTSRASLKPAILISPNNPVSFSDMKNMGGVTYLVDDEIQAIGMYSADMSRWIGC